MSHPAIPALPASATLHNLEAAFAGESMAHAKYRYFAKICRELGDDDTARHFEETAAQEIVHAHGHLELLFPKAHLTVAKCLALAIEGETHEYTEMYPAFRHAALAEGNTAAAREMDEQIAESKEHAVQFAAVLAKAAKRFDALTRVEQRHAAAYTVQLNKVTGA
jgi:rubrerythrin